MILGLNRGYQLLEKIGFLAIFFFIWGLNRGYQLPENLKMQNLERKKIYLGLE